MSFSPEQRLEKFAGDFFRLYGAETEIDENRMEVLVPGDLSGRLGVPEHFQVQTGPTAQGEFAIAYGSVFLEKILDHVCGSVPVTECSLRFTYIKSQGFDRLISDRFSFAGVSGAVENISTAMTRYIILSCRYTAQSDEQKEGLVSLSFNLETCAPAGGMEEMLYSADKSFEDKNRKTVLGKEDIARLIRAVEIRAQEVLANEIEPFQESMNRRFKRDVENLNAYYAALKQEMEDSLKRPGLSEQSIFDRKEKIDMIPDEVEKKTDDLFKKYSIKIHLTLCGSLIILSPCVKVRYGVRVGRKMKSLALIYNPVIKTMDPMVCQGCGAGMYAVGFCDAMHALCSRCRLRCPVCHDAVHV
jgi:hypothetical protein